MSDVRTVTVVVHAEDNSLWAEVPELPGVFASGHTQEELLAALEEAISQYMSDESHDVVADLRVSEDLAPVKRVPAKLALV